VADLFGRRMAVDIGTAGGSGDRIEGLRIHVRSRRTQSGSADPATITVYNGPPAVLGRLQDRGTVTRILAGYGDQLTQVVYGTTVVGSVRGPEQRGPDLVTTWQVLDGGTAYAGEPVMRAWVGDVRASEVVQAVAGDVGVPVAGLELGDDVTFPRGYFASGGLRRVLDDVTSSAGSVWSIIGGRLYVWPKGRRRVETSLVLGYGSGLVERPAKVDDKRWRVVALAQPGTLPGDRFSVDAEPGRGRYIAEDVEHDLDSLGYGPFTTTIIGRIDGR
jgi:hypothetical protein